MKANVEPMSAAGERGKEVTIGSVRDFPVSKHRYKCTRRIPRTHEKDVPQHNKRLSLSYVTCCCTTPADYVFFKVVRAGYLDAVLGSIGAACRLTGPSSAGLFAIAVKVNVGLACGDLGRISCLLSEVNAAEKR